MYDLACSLSVSECCVIKVDKAMSIPNSMRHLSVIVSSLKLSSSTYKSLCKSNKFLRTYLLVVSHHSYITPPHVVLRKLNYLRVLDLSYTNSKHISISMIHMKCLRYLNFSGSYLRLLPESICSLINLQTLKLVDCRELLMLPKDMRNLRSLRHLDLRGCLKLTKMPSNIGQMICLRTLSFFIVGKKRGHQVNELKTLKHLAGELQLKGLQHVKDSTDAKEVDFVNKQNLTSLELSWKFDNGVDCDLLEAKKSEEVLECLQPHLSLKKLVIKKYGGAMLPSWLHQLENLVEIELGECTRCVTLPPLGKLPLLKVLTICGMKSLKCITEFYQFQSLEQLCVWDMHNLETWDSRQNGREGGAFPKLRKSIIRLCPKLKSLPLKNLSCLSSLEIKGVDELLTFPEGSLRYLASLETLIIKDCMKLTSIPGEVGNLTALKSLEIARCNQLVSLPEEGLQNLTSLNLTSLKILSCGSLQSLPVMGMTQERMKTSSLVVLKIEECPILISLSEGLRYLSSLQTLKILRCESLEFSRGDFQHLSSLRDLELWGLPRLRSFPDVQNLTALQSLQIEKCSSLRMLPDGMQNLVSLQVLTISACHYDLHKRLVRNNGDDWHKISHIPQLRTMS
ncbi:hypothetical protein AQUCO_48100001v1 [Aquilegia coerulea]|uniref:NB-ARC domain-containing protein n=1 Tax=Aquilegia coerulea TaxID=218851 RepID=A0A2G5C0E8_AQUCA|nr:hypothetical protein AQUCO_48100001v1 [Aquilegia coerulea]